MAEQAPSPNEQRLLDNVTKRVRLWKDVEPFCKDADRGPYKSVESRDTESVLNALILSSRDAQSGQLSNDTQMAFQIMWDEQQTAGEQKGAWLWLRFKNEPWEADDPDYFGATLAAVAIGIAPGNYRATPEEGSAFFFCKAQRALTSLVVHQQQGVDFLERARSPAFALRAPAFHAAHERPPQRSGGESPMAPNMGVSAGV
jgi:hypothetical protein